MKKEPPKKKMSLEDFTVDGKPYLKGYSLERRIIILLEELPYGRLVTTTKLAECLLAKQRQIKQVCSSSSLLKTHYRVPLSKRYVYGTKETIKALKTTLDPRQETGN